MTLRSAAGEGPGWFASPWTPPAGWMSRPSPGRRRALSRLLDQADLLAGAYTLEVGSPGLERELRRPAQFGKALGREVVVTTVDPLDGSRRHRGVLDEVSGEAVTLLLGEGTRQIPFGQVAEARTVFRWEKAPKPGHKRG